MPRTRRKSISDSDSDDYRSYSESETEWDSDYDSADFKKEQENILTITTVEASLNTDDHLLIIQVDLTLSDATLITTRISSQEIRGDVDVPTALKFGTDCVNESISSALIGKAPTEQLAIDKMITQQLEEQCLKASVSIPMKKVAGNVTFAVSLVVCKAGAHVKTTPLHKHIKEIVCNTKKHKKMKKSKFPAPVLKVFNTSQLDLPNKQQFTYVPLHMPSFKQSIDLLKELYDISLRDHIIKNYGDEAINVDPDGGYTLNVSVRDASRLLHNIGCCSEYSEYIHVGVDFDASELDNPVEDNQEFEDFCLSLVRAYTLAFIKDPFGVDDWENYQKLTEGISFTLKMFEKQRVLFGEKPVVVAKNHSLVTDSKKLKKAIKKKIFSALFIEVNQLRSITECIEALKLAKRAGWKVFMSGHNSCKNDTDIADLFVGFEAARIEIGLPCIQDCTMCDRLTQIDLERIKSKIKCERWLRDIDGFLKSELHQEILY